MNTITRPILTGLATVVPIAVTLYFFYWLAITIEALFAHVLGWFLPEGLYQPGMGLVIGMLLIFVLGVLMEAFFVRAIFSWAENFMLKVPLIKTVYGTINDFLKFISTPKEKDADAQVVLLKTSDNYTVVGFVTKQFKEEGNDTLNGKLAVYLPMSYQVGGYTVIVEKDQVVPLTLTKEEAMRFILTGGVTGKIS